jgi:hypothetical protein
MRSCFPPEPCPGTDIRIEPCTLRIRDHQPPSWYTHPQSGPHPWKINTAECFSDVTVYDRTFWAFGYSWICPKSHDSGRRQINILFRGPYSRYLVHNVEGRSCFRWNKQRGDESTSFIKELHANISHYMNLSLTQIPSILSLNVKNEKTKRQPEPSSIPLVMTILSCP